MHYNKYKDKHHKELSLSTSFITAPNDKTLIMGSKEKKENTRMGKQTASVYAAKIKTKIHNTSSFFKLSLKSNNKALALALVAQKQKSRQLEAEVVRLRKDAQTTNFDLAFQRHKNKQLFAIIQEFYDSSLNWMSKAVDIFCNDEESDSMDTEHNASQVQMFEMEKEVFSLQNKQTLYPKQDTTGPEPVNAAMVKEATALNQRRDSLAQQNTLNDSEMEMTMSDSATEIVTVEINARRTSRLTEEPQKKKDFCLSEKGFESISAVEDLPVEFISAVSKETTVTHQCSPTVQKEVENGQETVTARRKTHVTSRGIKNSRRTCKMKEQNPDPRKTYLISQDPAGDVSELQNSAISKPISSDGNISSKAVKNKAKESHAPQEPRRTFIVQDELRLQSAKVSSLTVDHSLSVHENVESASAVCSEDAGTDVHVNETTFQVKKQKNTTPVYPISQLEKCNTRKNRGTYVIQTSHSFINSNSVLKETSVLEDSNRPEGSQEVLEAQTTPQEAGLVTIAQQQDEPEHVSQKKENAYHPECSKDVHVSFVQETSEFASSVPDKAKKYRKEVADKIKNRNAAKKEKSKALTKKKKNCALSMDEDVPTERRDVIDLQNEAGSLSNNLNIPEVSHCPAPEEDLWDEQYTEPPEINFPSVDHTDYISLEALSINLDQINQVPENRCRKTYVISTSHKSLRKEMTDSEASRDISEYHLSNKTDSSQEIASMLVIEKHNVTSEHFSGHPRDLQFTEERPPWETLDGYADTLSDESCADNPQLEACSQTMNIYQDRDFDIRSQAPEEGRVMKTLTNTDINSDVGRTRRRAAPVTYKEPSLNCKMRRGDKYSDTKFLNSPVFKDKKKKKRA